MIKKYKINKIFMVLILYVPSLAIFANEEDLTTSDLIIAKQWLAEKGGKQWKIFYNYVDGKKYRWNITKNIVSDEVHVSFKSGDEINDKGEVIGGPAMISDQFFILIIDRKTYRLKHVSLGG